MKIFFSLLFSASLRLCFSALNDFHRRQHAPAAHQQMNENTFSSLLFSAPLRLCVKLFTEEQTNE
jgi:hypothetical protein